jgi:hypothetical protein
MQGFLRRPLFASSFLYNKWTLDAVHTSVVQNKSTADWFLLDGNKPSTEKTGTNVHGSQCP